MKTIPNEGLLHFRGFFYTDRVVVVSPKALQEILVTKAYEFEKQEFDAGIQLPTHQGVVPYLLVQISTDDAGNRSTSCRIPRVRQ